MMLAKIVGIEVPVYGLIYSVDGSKAYFIKRFDRVGKNNKIAVEDFAQLSGKSRDTKYKSAMEEVTQIIQRYCIFPAIELKNYFN
jgi:serine/threonine-protein kinase HipA